MSSTLDMPLGDLISQSRSSKGGQRRQGGGGGRRPRAPRDGAAAEGEGAEGAAAGAGSSHPLDRAEGGASSGPIRNRRERRPRDEVPYARAPPREQYDYPTEGEQWTRGVPQLLPGTAKLVGDTVRVSNLSTSLTDEDLRFVFEKIGPIKEITLNYNAQGKSLGTGEIQFASNAAAANAVEHLDQAEVDGRIMYVNIVGQLVTARPLPSVRRYDDRRDDRRYDDRRGGDDRQPRGERRGGDDRRERQPRRDGQGGGRQNGSGARKEGGGGRGGRGGKGGREARPEAKATDLDAEMDSYMSESKKQDAQAASAAGAEPAAAQ